jgi:hypothetical protein
MSDDGDWFAPKRFGYGAGMPISWQGWAVTIAFVAGVAADTLLLRDSAVAFLSVLAILTVAFIVVAARTTRGGWRWRWGDGDSD